MAKAVLEVDVRLSYSRVMSTFFLKICQISTPHAKKRETAVKLYELSF